MVTADCTVASGALHWEGHQDGGGGVHDQHTRELVSLYGNTPSNLKTHDMPGGGGGGGMSPF